MRSRSREAADEIELQTDLDDSFITARRAGPIAARFFTRGPRRDSRRRVQETFAARRVAKDRAGQLWMTARHDHRQAMLGDLFVRRRALMRETDGLSTFAVDDRYAAAYRDWRNSVLTRC